MDKLVKNLVNGGVDNLKMTKEFIDTEHEGSQEKFELLKRKGVYPYSYIDEVSKFDEGMWQQIYILLKNFIALNNNFIILYQYYHYCF